MSKRLPSSVQAHGHTVLVVGRFALVLGAVLDHPAVARAIAGVPMTEGNRRDIDQVRPHLLAAGLSWWGSEVGSLVAETAEAGAVSLAAEITTVELAAMLGVTPRRARSIAGRIGGRKVGAQWVIDRSTAEAELARRNESEKS